MTTPIRDLELRLSARLARREGLGDPDTADLDSLMGYAAYHLRRLSDRCHAQQRQIAQQERMLEAHRRYHADVGCPGEKCHVCMTEDDVDAENDEATD